MSGVPSEMERQYRRFLIGRGDVIDPLFLCMRGVGDGSRAWAAFVLSRMYLVTGAMQLARSFLRLSASFFSQESTDNAPLGIWVNGALILWGRGDGSSAERILRRVLNLSMRRGDTCAASKAASNLSTMLARTGRHDEAVAFNGFAETCYRELENHEGLVRVDLTKALIEGTGGQPDEAANRITRILADCRGDILQRERIAASELLAEMFLAMDDLERANDALCIAASSRRALRRFRPLYVRFLVLRRLYHWKRGEEDLADRALRLATRMRDRLGLWGVEYEPASCARRQYDPRKGSIGRRDSCGASAAPGVVSGIGSREGNRFITADPVLLQLLDEVRRAAPLSAPVLLSGETGVGKEPVGRLIHYWSGRCEEPFLPINAAALTKDLFESTLFGHVRGAFTGASATRRGLLESAGKGTIFLDEIAELDTSLQAKLLRFLDRGEYIPVGGDAVRFSKARIIAATNRDLETLVKTGDFRNDLYFRLSVLTFTIPPLRRRKGDIPALAAYILSKAPLDYGLGHFTIDDDTIAFLMSYHWPGNVRELEGEILKAAVRARSGAVRPGHLSGRLLRGLAMSKEKAGEDLETKIKAFERREIEQALRDAAGNRSAAARILGLKRTTLIYRIKRLGIDSSDD